MMLRACDVSNWGFFRFTGPDAKEFLQGLVTADVRTLRPGECLPACVLTPKGLLAADCELFEDEGGVLAVTRPAAAAGFAAAFVKIIALSRSTFSRLSPRKAWLVFGEGQTAGYSWPRFGQPARLLIEADLPASAAVLSSTEFEGLRVAAGFPWYGVDIDATTLPLEVRQDAAISMSKGCFLGQETVARTVYRGHINRLLMGIKFESGAPAPGSVISLGGHDIGRLTSCSGGVGLGLVRSNAAIAGERVAVAGAVGTLMTFSAWPAPLAKASPAAEIRQ